MRFGIEITQSSSQSTFKNYEIWNRNWIIKLSNLLWKIFEMWNKICIIKLSWSLISGL